MEQNIIPKISDEKIQELFSKKLDYKLFIAESIVEHIPKFVPEQRNFEYLLLETYSETFLFFIVGVQDFLFNEIIERLDLKKDNKIEQVMKNLKNCNDLRAKKILDEFDKNFKQPFRVRTSIPDDFTTTFYPVSESLTETEDGKQYRLIWNYDSSYLFLLRKMRNHVSHDLMIYHGMYANSSASAFTIFIDKNPNPLKNMFEIFTPSLFFKEALDKTKIFVSTVRGILD